MSVALDLASSSNTTTPQTTKTWSHTVSGTNRLLVVIVGWNQPNNGGAEVVSAVTYNSVAMTSAGAAVTGNTQASGIDRNVQMFYLIAPATGSNTVSVTMTDSVSFAATAISFTGVNQSTPLGTLGTTSSTSAATLGKTTTSATADMVLSACCVRTASTVTTPTSQESNLLVLSNLTFATAVQAGAASVTSTYSWTGADNCAEAAIDVVSAGSIVTKTQSAIARIANTITKTQTAIARIATKPTKAQSATARVAVNLTKTQSAVSRVANSLTKTQSAITRIATKPTKTQSATGRIALNLTKAQSAISRISNSFTKTQSAIARIATRPTKTQSATARLVGVVTKTQSATARILGSTIKTQSAIARIANTRTKTQAGIAAIGGTGARTISAIARIAKYATKTQSATARIAATARKTQSGVASIARTFVKFQTCSARISNTIYLFAPPALDELPRTLAKPHRDDRFWRHIRHGYSARSVLKNHDGSYTVLSYPTQDQIAVAAAAYIGGHTYEVSATESIALQAAGFSIEVSAR